MLVYACVSRCRVRLLCHHSQTGRSDILGLLVKASCEINVVSQFGTPLDLAQKNNHSNCADVLLAARALPVAAAKALRNISQTDVVSVRVSAAIGILPKRT